MEAEELSEARLRAILRVVGWTIVVGAVPPIAHNVIGGRWASAVALLAAEAGALTALWLNRRGRLRAAIFVLVAAIQACAAVLAVTGENGFHDVSMMLFPATLVVAGLLLDLRAFATVAGVTVLLVLAIGVAELRGMRVTPFSPSTDVRDLADASIILGLTAVTVGLLARSLRASEERFRSLVDLAVDGILIGEGRGRITGVNRRMQELTGRTAGELVGRDVQDLFPAGELERAPLRWDLLDRGGTAVVERLVRGKDGTTVPVEMSSKRMPDGTFHSFFRDITERRRAEEEAARLQDELRHAQKMEAVGRLADGIAHDLNNMLMIIGASVAAALRDVAPGTRTHRCLSEVEQAAGRTAALTRRLLTFSRKEAIAPRVLDLADLVGSLRPMLAGIVRAGVTLEIDAPPNLGLVRVDAGQMEQALLNLALNARDAMPEGGRLALSVSDVALEGERAQALGLAPGPYVALRVADTGTGMTPDVREHLFEPFFTTKPPGKGTGLGLAMVYGAVRQNGGAIDVDSRPGGGSTFHLYFPRVTADPPGVTARTTGR